MNQSISHGVSDETIDAKAKWFKGLSLEERMNVFVAFTNLILENNPEIVKKKHARPASDRIRVLELDPKQEMDKKDLEDVRILKSVEKDIQ